MEPRRSVPGHNYWCEVNWFWTPANVVVKLEHDEKRIALICTCQPIDQPEWTAGDKLTWQVRCGKCGAPKGHYCVYTSDLNPAPEYLPQHSRSATARKKLAQLGRPTLRPHQQRRDAYTARKARRYAREARLSGPATNDDRSVEWYAIARANQAALVEEYGQLRAWLRVNARLLIDIGTNEEARNG